MIVGEDKVGEKSCLSDLRYNKANERRRFIERIMSHRAIVYLKTACLAMLRIKGDGLGFRC